MSKEKQPLTKKQEKSKYRNIQRACKIGEYAVIPVPFAALMIVNREEWFALPDTTWKIGLGASLTIALLIGAILMVVKESEDKNVANGYPLIMIKWIMMAIIFTVIEQVIHQISSIMWIATSGLAASFGLDITRNVYRKKYEKVSSQLEAAEQERGKQQAMQELEAEEKEKKVRIVIKK